MKANKKAKQKMPPQQAKDPNAPNKSDTIKSHNWARLDNAAKIFPPSSSKRDTKVFRFSCELKEEVLPDLLQKALIRALKEFPFYRSVLKQGFFWNYFEQSDLPAIVHEENDPPCQPLYDVNSHSLLFEVTYYRRRVNLEIYHALSDGTGALQFLRTLVFHYLLLRHPAELGENQPQMDYDASVSQREEDSFQKYYTGAQKEDGEKVHAYQLHGTQLPEGRLRVIEGICSTKAVLCAAHEKQTTMTVYLTAAMLCAIAEGMPLRERKKPVVLCVPVNLRNHFSSETARNFFSVINVGYTFGQREIDFADVVRCVQQAFESQLRKEKLAAHVNKLIAFEKNPMIRIVPLPVKRFFLRIFHDRDRKNATGTISNIGRVNMPENMHPFIERFTVFVSTTRVQTCVCSFGENLSVAFTSPFVSTEVQKYFFRMLTAAGVPVRIVSNLVDGESE